MNAQILLVVRGSVAADALRAAIERAGRGAGFSAGPSTYASGSSTAIRNGALTTEGVFSDGPWLGFSFASETALPTVPSNVEWSAIRMNLMGGPDGSAGLDAVANALRAMPATIRLASRSPRNAISWDRGVPASIPLTESTSPGSSNGGFLLGLGVVAALAWFARSGVR
jgi:hypothetical protein